MHGYFLEPEGGAGTGGGPEEVGGSLFGAPRDVGPVLGSFPSQGGNFLGSIGLPFLPIIHLSPPGTV